MGQVTGPQKFALIVGNTCSAASPNIGGLLNAKLVLDAAGCGGSCTSNAECDDGDACNGLETCDLGSGACQSGVAVDCDDADACTIDSCDPATGACSTQAVDCDDADLCTVDSCDPLGGCANDPVVCPIGQSCDPATGGCVAGPVCNNNGICEGEEDCKSCPGDCVGGTSSGAVCGDGVCEAGNGEDCVSCPADCNGQTSGKPSGRFCCGDGDGTNPLPCSDPVCSTGGWTCTDLPSPGGTFCCGDDTCEGDEGCGNCALDCTEPAEDCTDGRDNDCNLAADCADAACTEDPSCQVVDCSIYGDKTTCNAQPTCRWDNRGKTCVPN